MKIAIASAAKQSPIEEAPFLRESCDFSKHTVYKRFSDLRFEGDGTASPLQNRQG